MKEITPAQQRVLQFYRDSFDIRGVAPTLREVCFALGFQSTNAVNDHVAALVRKGALQPRANQRRHRAQLLTARGRELTTPPQALRRAPTGLVLEEHKCPCGASHFRAHALCARCQHTRSAVAQ